MLTSGNIIKIGGLNGLSVPGGSRHPPMQRTCLMRRFNKHHVELDQYGMGPIRRSHLLPFAAALSLSASVDFTKAIKLSLLTCTFTRDSLKRSFPPLAVVESFRHRYCFVTEMRTPWCDRTGPQQPLGMAHVVRHHSRPITNELIDTALLLPATGWKNSAARKSTISGFTTSDTASTKKS